MTAAGRFRVHFNRHSAAPLVWSVCLLDRRGDGWEPLWEITVRHVTLIAVTTTVYVPKSTDDEEDGKPSAWLVADGTLTIEENGEATIR